MKTLDEVIELMEAQVGELYGITGVVLYAEDILHYLKNYRDSKEWIELEKKNYAEAVDNCEKAEAKYTKMVLDNNRNDPLTWEQLTRMEGKPVWVEQMESGKVYGSWFLIQSPAVLGDVYMVSRYRARILLYEKEMGTVWQAYRKERE